MANEIEISTELEKKRPSIILIILVWIGVSFATVLTSALMTSEITNMSLISPLFSCSIVICVSILHPGGWLGLAGLFTTIGTRKFIWLLLSVIGAILTGITAPYFEAIGAASF